MVNDFSFKKVKHHYIDKNNYYIIDYFKTGIDTARGLDDMHDHDFIQIWYVLNGECILNFNGNDFTLSKGDLIIIPTFVKHLLDTRYSEGIKLFTCWFSEDFINNSVDGKTKCELFNLAYLQPVLMNANLIKPFLHFENRNASQIESILNELHNLYLKSDKFVSMSVRVNIIKLLNAIALKYEELVTSEHIELFTKYRTSLQNAIDYINGHFTERLYLSGICRIALMSPSPFSYIFKQITGNTFTEYVQYLRVMRACELLKNTDRKLLDIALECGFSNETYFQRVFRKLTRMSPGQYRRIQNCRT